MDIKHMNLTLLLLFAALLEAGGDALVRAGFQASTNGVRAGLFVVGGLVLFSYGYIVNAQPWDFGRLLGVYVVFFFVMAQLISWIIFHQRPGAALLIGGALIVAGGIIISCNR
jgi:drug/metabolite transporter superfamily protein YnfA